MANDLIKNLISLDVNSLFINVPTDLIKKFWIGEILINSNNCLIPRNEFLGAVRFVLDSTYFMFNDQYYKQNFETPMESSLSPLVVDLCRILKEKCWICLILISHFFITTLTTWLLSYPPQKPKKYNRRLNLIHFIHEFNLRWKLILKNQFFRYNYYSRWLY